MSSNAFMDPRLWRGAAPSQAEFAAETGSTQFRGDTSRPCHCPSKIEFLPEEIQDLIHDQLFNGLRVNVAGKKAKFDRLLPGIAQPQSKEDVENNVRLDSLSKLARTSRHNWGWIMETIYASVFEFSECNELVNFLKQHPNHCQVRKISIISYFYNNDVLRRAASLLHEGGKCLRDKHIELRLRYDAYDATTLEKASAPGVPSKIEMPVSSVRSYVAGLIPYYRPAGAWQYDQQDTSEAVRMSFDVSSSYVLTLEQSLPRAYYHVMGERAREQREAKQREKSTASGAGTSTQK
ncbi:MAG: hypothetical protein M1828_001893 [Chrysothrix sp. TS-e1954]|nr:MAG: hypothetical protein M1828_001893 [Chrysothrix sp. TS-e1954]